MSCPFHKLKEGLPPLTERLKKLPVDERGYPVPFFVAWIDGRPEFRMADPAKLVRCVREQLCWVCGDKLGAYQSFTIGPMCVINRTTAEPPEHKECAEWSVKGCPFLSRPNMVRREDDLTESMGGNVPGVMIKRNPGATCIWTTKSHRWFPDGNGGHLVRIGDPVEISWWREGRPATRAEVLESMNTGLPLLEQHCYTSVEREALKKATDAAMVFVPNE